MTVESINRQEKVFMLTNKELNIIEDDFKTINDKQLH